MADDAAELETWEDKLAQQGLDAEHATESRATLITFLVVLSGFSVGIFAAIVVVRSITGSIARMLRMIQGITDKDLTLADIPISNDDEIGKAEVALNTMKNNLGELIHSIAAAAKGVNGTSEQISIISRQITENSKATSAQVAVVSGATQQVSDNLQTVATGAQEMSATIQSIATNAQGAAGLASAGVKTAEAADVTVNKLVSSSAEIGAVVKTITTIAQQTSLLA